MLGQYPWMFTDGWDASIAKTPGAVVLDEDEWRHHAFIPGKGDDANILVVAHMDSVAKPSQPRFHKQSFYAPTVDNRIGFFIATKWLPSVGIYPDVLLTDHEEMANSTAKWFSTEKQYRWMVQFDRMDMDVALYQYRTDEMEKAVEGVGMTPTHGSYTCICDLEDLGCAGFNWGVGYRDYHGPGAHVNLDELTHNLRAFKKFWDAYHEHTFEFKVTKYRSYSYGYGTWNREYTTSSSYNRNHYHWPKGRWTGGINGRWVSDEKDEDTTDWYINKECIQCKKPPTHVRFTEATNRPVYACDDHADERYFPIRPCLRCGTKRGGEEAAKGRYVLASYWWGSDKLDTAAACHYHYKESGLSAGYNPAPHRADPYHDRCEWCDDPAEHIVGDGTVLCTTCAAWYTDNVYQEKGDGLQRCDVCGDYLYENEVTDVEWHGEKMKVCNECIRLELSLRGHA